MTEWTSRPQMDLSRRSGKDVRTRRTKPQTQIHTVCTFNTLSLMPVIQHYHSHNNQHTDITDQRTCWDTISDSKQEDEGFTWLSWFFNQASSMFYGRHEQTQTHKVLRKCMNEATVYWVHVPRQETQINTVIARKRWRMEEERGKKSVLSLHALCFWPLIFDLEGAGWLPAMNLSSKRNVLIRKNQKEVLCGCLCIFSNYNKYNLFQI